MKKRPLQPIDFIFLNLERKHQPMHLAGLLVFDLPEHADAYFIAEVVTAYLSGKYPVEAPFNEVLSGLSWQRDEQIDISQHFQHIQLQQATLQDVTQYVSQLHSQPLERDKPMWHCTLIEGLQHRQFAIYLKVHHAKLDGIAGMRVISRSLSRDEQDSEIVPLWSKRPQSISHKNGQQTKNTIQRQHSFIRQLGQFIQSSRKVLGRVLENIQQRHQAEHYSTFDTPKSILNQKITAQRTFVVQSYDLERIRCVAKHFNLTMNDMILVLSATALRHYLLEQNQLPSKPLSAFVPVSIRSDDTSLSNHFSFVLANLATHLADPIQRLQQIKASMDYAKSRFQAMSGAEILAYTALVYAIPSLQIFSGLTPTIQPFNLVISSVITSKEPLYLNGARLAGLYPASVLFHGQALNLTMASYCNRLDLGLTANAETLAQVEKILDYFAHGLDEYEQFTI